MNIMGVDPGIARVGWAAVETHGRQVKRVSYSCIMTEAETREETRLNHVFSELTKLLRVHKPNVVAVEELFFATNAKTAMIVGQSRGVILLAAARAGVSVVSYSPLEVKRAVCGDGRADKKAVQRMVKTLLKLKDIPKPDDAADALAIALTHVYTHKMS